MADVISKPTIGLFELGIKCVDDTAHEVVLSVAGEALHIDMELVLASFDSISEVNMVSLRPFVVLLLTASSLLIDAQNNANATLVT